MNAPTMNVRYEVVEGYHREAQLKFFSQYENPFWSVTFDVDVSGVRRYAKAKGYSTYFNLCRLVTGAMQEVEEFRYRLKGDQVVLYERLHFSATVPTADGLFGFARVPFREDLEEANQEGITIFTRAREEPLLEDRPLHPNFVFFSALPKVAFSGLTHVLPLRKTDGEPRVTFGRFDELGGRLIAPVGLTVNHLLIDGEAVGELVEGLEAALEGFSG